MNYPAMVRIMQHFNTHSIQDIPAAVRAEMEKIRLQEIITPGAGVAITAGSRGIANINTILAEVVAELKKIGARPFIVPAMGSHGGATGEGQKRIIEHYGITETAVDAPIKSSMEVVEIGTTSDGIPVLLDRNAFEADHIIVVNLLVSVAREIIRRCPIAFGLALVENQKDETEIIQAILPDRIEETERELLVKAKGYLARIPFDPIDILIVDEMGKDISGTGMDQNVIARTVIPYHQVPARPKITRIFVRDLSAGSEGNATAIGNADFTTSRLVAKIDHSATYMNAITSSCPEAVRIPPYFESDREVLDAALKTIGDIKSKNARIVHIRDTLHLEQMVISEPMLAEAAGMDGVSIEGSPAPMDFDAHGNLISNL
ncbi:MAG: lactate racemase domain-containing protein [Desulfobacterales bacterium]